MVACARNVFERHQALFDALSSRVFRISERVGDGARTKLVNNLAAAINLVGAAEVLVMAQKMGLDLGRTLNVIEQSSGQSWIASGRVPFASFLLVLHGGVLLIACSWLYARHMNWSWRSLWPRRDVPLKASA
jgi:hypothetical protein